jgi:signal transduction histidine kinase
MKIGTRVSMWYAGLLALSFSLLALILYVELVIERNFRIKSGIQADSIQEEIIEIVFYYGVPTALLLIGVGWRSVQRSLVPLNRLTEAAEEINATTLHKRLPRSMNQDELDRLTEVFNTMISRLGDSFFQVREFTLHASHELKTPLSILHASMENMINNPKTTDEQKEELELRLLEIHRLTSIVENLTFLAKADSGQIPMRYETISFNELMEEIHADAQILGRDRKIKVSLKHCDKVIMSGDSNRLRQLLLNIVDNAIKYNEVQRIFGPVSFHFS